VSAPRVEVHIDELVLDGFERNHALRIGDALPNALARLLEERGAPSNLAEGGDFEAIDGGSIRLAPCMRPELIGERVGLSVYEGLVRSNPDPGAATSGGGPK
jgi:hypothetical protein